MEMEIGTFREGLRVGMSNVVTSATFVALPVTDVKKQPCPNTGAWHRRSRLLIFNVKKKLRTDVEVEGGKLDFAIMHDGLLLVRSNKNGRDSRGYMLLRSQREIHWI